MLTWPSRCRIAAGLRVLLDRQTQASASLAPTPARLTAPCNNFGATAARANEAVDKVAAAMHQSTRTLQRRLAERGMTWQQLLDNTRMNWRQYLADPALSGWRKRPALDSANKVPSPRRWMGADSPDLSTSD